ncbi:MAG: hypothetical protein ACOYBP_05630 [Microbacteriaceae bacterium]
MPRSLVILVELLAGLVFGALMAFGHQAVLEIGDVVLPWGIVVACLGVLALLLGVRLLAPSRSDVIWVALGVMIAVFVLALPSPSGTVLVPNGIVGMVWVFAPTAIAVLVVLWPTRPVSRIESVERTLS